MTEDRYLPGLPRPKLVRETRKALVRYGVRPSADTDKLWCIAWAWAAKIARSYYFDQWPNANEIAAHYMMLVVAEMKANFVRPHFRALEQLTPAASAVFAEAAAVKAWRLKAAAPALPTAQLLLTDGIESETI